jgi:hypothetical protein
MTVPTTLDERHQRARRRTLPRTGRPRLALDSLFRAAEARVHLHDFGDDSFREPLGILVDAINEESQLHDIARSLVRLQLIDLLITRLRMHDLLRRHPEIEDVEVPKPIVILGIPRSGTTFLHRLLACDPGLRWLRTWEVMFPVPEHDGSRRRYQQLDDARTRRAAQVLKFMHLGAPDFPAIHALDTNSPEEESILFCFEFRSLLFEGAWRIPSYRDWYLSHDQSEGYRFVRRVLQTAQWSEPGERWLMKSPQHTGNITPLLKSFPDATLIQTHRDPSAVIGSVCSLCEYLRAATSIEVNRAEIGAYWTDRLEVILQRNSADRRTESMAVCDVQYTDIVQSPMRIVRTVYAAAGRDLDPIAEARMLEYIAANPRQKHGRHDYEITDYGLDQSELHDRFRWYLDAFDVAQEGSA